MKRTLLTFIAAAVMWVAGLDAMGQSSRSFVPGSAYKSCIVREWTADTSLACYYDGTQYHWLALDPDGGVALQADMPSIIKVNDFEIDGDFVYFVGSMQSPDYGIIGCAKIGYLFTGLPFDYVAITTYPVGGNGVDIYNANFTSIDRMAFYRDDQDRPVVAFLGSSYWDPSPSTMRPRVYGLATCHGNNNWSIVMDLNKDQMRYTDIAVTEKNIVLPFSQPEANDVCMRIIGRTSGLTLYRDFRLTSEQAEGDIIAEGLDADKFVLGYGYDQIVGQSVQTHEMGLALAKFDIATMTNLPLEIAHLAAPSGTAQVPSVKDIRYSAAQDWFGMLASFPVGNGFEDEIMPFDNAISIAGTQTGHYNPLHRLSSIDFGSLPRCTAAGSGSGEVWLYRKHLADPGTCFPELPHQWLPIRDKLVAIRKDMVRRTPSWILAQISCTPTAVTIDIECR